MKTYQNVITMTGKGTSRDTSDEDSDLRSPFLLADLALGSTEQGSTEVIVNRVAAQCQGRERLLEWWWDAIGVADSDSVRAAEGAPKPSRASNSPN